jgi:hypothetical protein
MDSMQPSRRTESQSSIDDAPNLCDQQSGLGMQRSQLRGQTEPLSCVSGAEVLGQGTSSWLLNQKPDNDWTDGLGASS